MEKSVTLKNFINNNATYVTWKINESEEEIHTQFGIFKHAWSWDGYRDGSIFYFLKSKDVWYRLRLAKMCGFWVGEIYVSVEFIDDPEHIEPGSIMFNTHFTFRESGLFAEQNHMTQQPAIDQEESEEEILAQAGEIDKDIEAKELAEIDGEIKARELAESDAYKPALQSISAEILLDIIEPDLLAHKYGDALLKVKAQNHMDLRTQTEIFCEVCFLAFVHTKEADFLNQAQNEILAWKFKEPLRSKKDFWCDVTLAHLGSCVGYGALNLWAHRNLDNTGKLSPELRYNHAVALVKATLLVVEGVNTRSDISTDNILNLAHLCSDYLPLYAAIAMALKTKCPSLMNSGVDLFQNFPVQPDDWNLNCHLAIADNLLSLTK